MRRGDEHGTVHHNTACRKRLETEMNKDETYSKKLSEVEERKKGYLARRVEASDKERIEATRNPSRAEPVEPGATAVTGVEPGTAVETLTRGMTTILGVAPEVTGIPPSTIESQICDWIECSHDRRTWAEVQEEEQRERAEGRLRPSPALLLSSSTRISADTKVPGNTSKPQQKPHHPRGGATGKEESKYDVCEVFSPPRICVAATEHGLRGGWSIDIATNERNTMRRFDLRNQKDQSEVKRMIRRDCPTVVVVSPPCTAFSIANQGEVDEHTLRSAVEMVRFSMEVCALQHTSGRHFIFEQPQSSRAWSLNEVVKMT